MLSIGAVKFDLDSDAIDDAAFYASVSVDSNTRMGRSTSESTLWWWMKQSDEAKAVFGEPKQHLQTVLPEFCDWFHGATYIWSNGADFDIPMLAHALRQHELEPPWNFWNARCARTYKNLPGVRDIRIENPMKHSALHDAIAQAKHMQAIQRKLNDRAHPMVKGK